MKGSRPWTDSVVKREDGFSIRIPPGWTQIRAEMVMLDYDQCVAGDPNIKAGGEEDFVDFRDFMFSSGIGDVVSEDEFLAELKAIDGLEFDDDNGIRWTDPDDRAAAWASVGAPVHAQDGNMQWLAAVMHSRMGMPVALTIDSSRKLTAVWPAVDVVVRDVCWGESQGGSQASISLKGLVDVVWSPVELRVALDHISMGMLTKPEPAPEPTLAPASKPEATGRTPAYKPRPKRLAKTGARDWSGLIPIAIILVGLAAVVVAYLLRQGGS